MTSSNHLRCTLLATLFSLILPHHQFAAEPQTISGKAAVDADWKSDAPGVRHKITLEDLPPPYATESVTNDANLVDQPPGAQPQVPPGFRIEQYASGFRDPVISSPRPMATSSSRKVAPTQSKFCATRTGMESPM